MLLTIMNFCLSRRLFFCYNQIQIIVEDIPETAFRCLSSILTFEWLVMPFGFQKGDATYQRAMNPIFYDMLGHHMEIFIGDIMVKFKRADEHVGHLRECFERMIHHQLKLNPLKCVFRVNVKNFLIFLVHQRRIKVGKNKVKATTFAKATPNKKEL